MKKMTIAYIIWVVLVVLLVSILTFMGFLYKEKVKPYKSAEEELIDITKKYVELNFSYPEEKSVLTVTLNDLKQKELINSLEANNKQCDGYVEVTFNGVYNYKAFVKCGDFKTKGYKN